jgi:hypothetical protein
VFEKAETISRFPKAYSLFKSEGGTIINSLSGLRTYDRIIGTFVLETICPYRKRLALLKECRMHLRKGGIIISSFRGYSGVIGTRYKVCSKKEGYISPLSTFIKPHSIGDVRKLFVGAGLGKTYHLQRYKVLKPKNIHIYAIKD